ncbi:hypothetical protein A2960_05085 [Candidatus Gottesmanbacteria bacterium RIFCSPLOWO2_01_FULL_39_12b]|uniref:DUF2029 domain-containing protein n=1 Tax=Candidatus Gottesmanbacteria bacterium RIFCSPLOWO2_01_FULL_39_12b TaxID=1798388 RepID=A0A1F6ALY5_9BACT|nr:MAG: hypothetical protein A2960_05085 [Candidatus Gottesmanbacteria bacterium RIFCSPLOWO2_01_FULL_39_12b]
MIFERLRHDTINIFLLGIILRLVIIPFTFNWDLSANTKVASSFSFSSIREFYREPLAAYPPLMYTLLKSFLTFSSPLLNQYFNSWMHMGDISGSASPYIYRILSVVKLPYIILELLSAFIFSKFFTGQKARDALLLWMVNPIMLFLVAGWTNVDVIPLFALLLFLLFKMRGKDYLSSFCLGLSVSLKLFPVFLLPFLFITINSWKKRILAALFILLPVITTHLPILTTPQYFSHAITGGYSRKIMFSLIPIGDNRSLLPFALGYFLLFLYFLNQKKISHSLMAYSFTALIPLFAFSSFNLQWFLWILPFIFYYQLTLPQLRTPFKFLYLSFTSLVLLSQMSLNFGMLSPIEPTLLTYDWPLKEFIGNDNLFLMMNILHTLLTSSLLWIGYGVLKSMEKEKTNAQI